MYTGDVLCHYCFKRMFYKVDSYSNPICRQCAENLSPPLRYMGKPIGRNQVCPCGSGAKFKKCCMNTTVRKILPVEDKQEGEGGSKSLG